MHWLTDDYVTFVTGNAYLLGDLTLLVEFCVLFCLQLRDFKTSRVRYANA